MSYKVLFSKIAEKEVKNIIINLRFEANSTTPSRNSKCSLFT